MWLEVEVKRESAPQLRKDFIVNINKILQAFIWGLACYLMTEHHVKLTITSLIRTEKENKRVGGSPTSKHREEYKMAVDIRTKDWPEGLTEIVKNWVTKHWGSMLYVLIEDSHLHFHLRPHIVATIVNPGTT